MAYNCVSSLLLVGMGDKLLGGEEGLALGALDAAGRGAGAGAGVQQAHALPEAAVQHTEGGRVHRPGRRHRRGAGRRRGSPATSWLLAKWFLKGYRNTCKIILYASQT